MYARNRFDELSGSEFTREDQAEVDRLLRQGLQNLHSDREKVHSEVCLELSHTKRQIPSTDVDQGKSIFVKGHTGELWHPLSHYDLSGGLDVVPAAPITSDINTQKTNPTMLSDEMLLSWTPVFIIRNPILVAQSWYLAESRVGPFDFAGDNWRKRISIRFSRAVFDWYRFRSVDQYVKPIVIDADDLVENERAITELCRLCNMNENCVLYQWDVKGDDPAMSARRRSYIQGLYHSSGVDKSKSAKGITMSTQFAVWQHEYGVDIANTLRKYAEDNMADYLYLKGFKI